MELTPRLAAILKFIPPGTRVADIGTDHAKLPLNLIKTNWSSRVIATDLNEKPYQEACRQVILSGLEGRVEIRKGDGLEVIQPGEVDVIVIAGMGGNAIIRILERSPQVLNGVRRLLLQPMADSGTLRNWLTQNGWHLMDEELIKEEGRFYVIIVVEPGEGYYEDQLLMEIGPLLINKCSPILIEYLEKIKLEYQHVLSGLARSRTSQSIEKAIEITTKLSRLKEVIGRCKQSAG